MELNDDTILGFWQWFVKNERTIKECIENDNSVHREFVVEQLNERILSFGMLTWDIGLNEDDNWFLTLSPNGNKDILKISQSIMAEAPDHMDWIFHASKPAKNWNRQFSVYDDYLDEQLVDASNWHYLIFEDGDGKLALILEASNVSHLNEELTETAAEQFIIHELGELTWMLHVGSVEIIPMVEPDHEELKNHVSDLKEHLVEILGAQI
jgi:hypothetical protein